VTSRRPPAPATACLALLALAACASDPVPAPVYWPAPSAPVEAPAAPAGWPVSPWFAPDLELSLCRGLDVRNAPYSDTAGRIERFSPFVQAAPGVVLAMVPTNGACLTSGFGDRRGSFHRGLDLQSRPPQPVHAAGPGRVAEMDFRGGYGNYVVIDHGQGIFTRYAHLEYFQPGLAPGVATPFGAPIGMMGGTAIPPVSPHLHYEILTGRIDTPRASFGLDAIDPFSLPPAPR
jgi:murein DD-endopeptidase MepM/ murein hydrolase activator NlpD